MPTDSGPSAHNTTDGARLLAALQGLDDSARCAGGTAVVWEDSDRLLVFAELLGLAVEMVTVEPDAWNIHLADDEVLVLDLSGDGAHKLVSLDMWGLSTELRSMLGSDGSVGG